MRRVVIGIGNPLRGDDAAGRMAARRLRGTLPADVAVLEIDGEATTLLAALDGAAAAFLIDACVSGAPAGSVHRFDLAEGSLPSTVGLVSSHALGLADALELARALSQLPERCIVYAIEGRSFEPGAKLSRPMLTALGSVVRRLHDELSEAEECTKPR